eukprot:CAMPEP_0174850792 /NCGR_PEP_ID=MMETSP1114-20130205/21139_1 /TAXON_ID=312471 /ORGANISM="Neobodo designis, Strain CCAP 1951/1" /LENGTH=363 /DNA_ID=CAMNT_0016085279 /DNA_START=74 /DNA_END=1165 /DNA_ORIENTATION=+
MSKKNKGRGTKMSLADLGGGDDGKNLDWAQDEFAPTPPTGPAAPGQAVPEMGGKPKKDWRDFGFKAGSIEGNFREMAPVQNTNVVPVDMQAPFVAYVGNLPHNIEPATVEDNFSQVLEARVVRHDRSTFAYVEFETRDALQAAILTSGKNVGGRKIKVDIATDQQRARLEQERKGGNSGRESAAAASFGGRDAMGAAQPSAPSMGGRSGSKMGSRNASAMDLTFSRDGMGQTARSGGDPMSPASPAPEFSRDVFGAAQPPPPRTPNSGGGGRNFRDRGSKPASPVAGGMPDFGNFRDGDRAEQPAAASPADRGAPTFARRKEAVERKSPEGETKAGGWRDAPAPAQPKAAAVNSWRSGPPAAK